MLYLLVAVGTLAIWMAPVFYIWCVKPRKSLKEGLKDWVFESQEDI